MSQSRGNILFGERLKEGRMFRKMTQSDLAHELGISKQAVSQYETGANLPKQEVLEKIYEVLDLPNEYFTKEIEYNISTPVFFRKLKTAARRDYDSFEVTIHWMINIYQYLKKFVKFPTPNFPRYDKDEYTFDEIQEIAIEVRKFWGLGMGPISNMNLLLENNGFIISKISKNASKVDACSILASIDGEAKPFIFLSSDKSAVRSRFDAAHEFGHHVLHYGMDKEMYEDRREELEKEANCFASAFLVPENAIRRELFSINSLDSFLSLKRRWLVSVAALIYRCSDLELFDSKQIDNLRRRHASRGWKKREPLDDLIPHEEVSVFGKALELILEAKIQTPQDIFEALSLPRKIVTDLCGISPSLLENSINNRPDLKLIK